MNAISSRNFLPADDLPSIIGPRCDDDGWDANDFRARIELPAAKVAPCTRTLAERYWLAAHPNDPRDFYTLPVAERESIERGLRNVVSGLVDVLKAAEFELVVLKRRDNDARGDTTPAFNDPVVKRVSAAINNAWEVAS